MSGDAERFLREVVDELFLLVLKEIDVLNDEAVLPQEIRQVHGGQVRNVAGLENITSDLRPLPLPLL